MGKHLLWVTLAIFGSSAHAQWLNYPAPGTPRTRDGKPDLAARAPRTYDGKPDLSGVWHVKGESIEEKKRLFGPDYGRIVVPGMEPGTTSKYALNIFVDYPPGEIIMRPEAQAIFDRRRKEGELPGPTRCLPLGIPGSTLVSEVHKIVQAPGLIIIMLELDSMTRQIHTDGRKLPVDSSPSWLGYSVGKWEGDTLVVDTIGFNDRTWLDGMGHPHSEDLHLVERYRRPDFGHLNVEMTFDDPKMYNKPFTVKVTHLLQADSDILEYVCAENEKDRIHLGPK
ncbi:MAG: hypothetical protein M3N41_07970 [Acidobacteriota bacterium]|nr:hypothetical protein [Acidobacteriota bacterium]